MIGFEELLYKLEVRLKAPLPGPTAHERMRALFVGNSIPRFDHKSSPRKGSVLLVLYPDANRILFPLIKRPDYEGLHSGQISFPGGKAEPGEDIVTTALREGKEEIGIDQQAVQIIGKLSDFFVIPSNFVVTPVVGYSTIRPVLVPDPVEVAKILHGDVESILPDSVILEREITAGGLYQMKAPHFQIENEMVWGATAMMLNEFRTIVKEILTT